MEWRSLNLIGDIISRRKRNNSPDALQRLIRDSKIFEKKQESKDVPFMFQNNESFRPMIIHKHEHCQTASKRMKEKGNVRETMSLRN